MPFEREDDAVRANLAGGKPGREPKSNSPDGKSGTNKSLGDQAFMDAVIVVGCAWLVLVLLSYSLRRHNI